MKIQCDVCDKEEASAFCSADEAALCQSCDHRVHHANKLASKHLRFSLLRPSLKDFPLCDICQERRALLFCQQDRVPFYRECYIPIHKANERIQKHNRCLLTGAKLSPSSSAHQTSSSSRKLSASSSLHQTSSSSSVSNSGSTRTAKNESAYASNINYPFDFRHNFTANTSESEPNHFSFEIQSHCTNQDGSVSTSSISEYLMENLPGWHVEDFLDPSCSPHCFCKTHDQVMSPFVYEESESTVVCFSPVKDLALWVPRAPMGFHTKGKNGTEMSEELKNVMNFTMKWNADDFMAPRIGPPSI